MSGNILWKFILTLSIVAWCWISITPLQDRPFEDYILSRATAEVEAFEDIVERARDRVEASREDVDTGRKTLFLPIFLYPPFAR